MKPKHIHLLSFNASLVPFAWHPYRRIDLLARQNAALQAEVVNLQEVHTYDMLWQLQRRLPHLPHIVYKPGLIGPRAGLVTLSRRPIKIAEFTSLSLHKGMLITSLDTVRIANVHLLANTDGDWSETNRFYPKQKEQLVQLQAVLEKVEQPLVLSGDFNLAKTSPLYTDFIRKGGWCDTAADAHSPTFHGEFLPRGRQPQRIDYIFTRGNITSLNAERVFQDRIAGTLLSNHMGLAVELI